MKMDFKMFKNAVAKQFATMMKHDLRRAIDEMAEGLIWRFYPERKVA